MQLCNRCEGASAISMRGPPDRYKLWPCSIRAKLSHCLARVRETVYADISDINVFLVVDLSIVVQCRADTVEKRYR